MTRMSCDSAIRFLSFSPLSDTTCKVTGFHMLADEEMTTLEIPESGGNPRILSARARGVSSPLEARVLSVWWNAKLNGSFLILGGSIKRSSI